MLLHLIAIPATTSTAIMNVASLISTTTTKEFTENTGYVVTASAQQQQQQQAIPTRGGARNK
jgi:hypothetical protein